MPNTRRPLYPSAAPQRQLLHLTAPHPLRPVLPAQVPLNTTSCEVENPWQEEEPTVLDEELCDILTRNGGIRTYATSNLLAIWGLGSPVQPPA